MQICAGDYKFLQFNNSLKQTKKEKQTKYGPIPLKALDGAYTSCLNNSALSYCIIFPDLSWLHPNFK